MSLLLNFYPSLLLLFLFDHEVDLSLPMLSFLINPKKSFETDFVLILWKLSNSETNVSSFFILFQPSCFNVALVNKLPVKNFLVLIFHFFTQFYFLYLIIFLAIAILLIQRVFSYAVRAYSLTLSSETIKLAYVGWNYSSVRSANSLSAISNCFYYWILCVTTFLVFRYSCKAPDGFLYFFRIWV